MTPLELQERASQLYGRNWQTALALRVRVAVRTVRHWAAGDRAVPDWLDWALGVLERNPGER